MNYTPDSSLNTSPLYKTSARAGVLSTTGRGSNLVNLLFVPVLISPGFLVFTATLDLPAWGRLHERW